jgi:hypothetical protein
MELLALIGICIGAVLLYFGLGIALKFVWGWWILSVSIPTCIYLGLTFGWTGAVIAVLALLIAVALNDKWHGSTVYVKVSNKLDRLFMFNDT